MYFPSDFAKRICKRIKLYPKKDITHYQMRMGDEDRKIVKAATRMVGLHEMLQTFQNLATTMSFRDSLEAYEEMHLNKEQIESLEKIHNSTYNWIKGQLIDKILTKIDETNSAKEIKELTETITILVNGDGASVDASKIVSYIVNTS